MWERALKEEDKLGRATEIEKNGGRFFVELAKAYVKF